jgi:hypothetical protein
VGDCGVKEEEEEKKEKSRMLYSPLLSIPLLSAEVEIQRTLLYSTS